MRHGKKFNHLGRQAPHRKAMLANMACSLIEHKRISTTLAKAKALRKYIEPLVTRSKDDTTHNRRIAFRYLKQKEAITELFSTVAAKVGERPGGYVRILRNGFRKGDNAEMCIIEFVDFNETMTAKSGKAAAKKTRRSRSSKGKSTEATAAAVAAAPVAGKVVEEVAEEKVEEKVEEAVEETVEEAAEEKVEEKVEEVVEETPAEPETPAEAPEADDLTKVEGIGPKVAEALAAAGITTFAGLSASNAANIQEILDAADGNFGGQVPTTWADQAKMAADGKWDELKKWQDELDGGKAPEAPKAESKDKSGEEE